VYQNSGGLGISFTPPAWLRQTGTAIVKGITLTVPTQIGPVSVNPQQAAAAARGASVTYTPPRPASEGPAEFVERAIPGGWGTVGLAAAAVIALMLVMGGRGRGGR
jgi:hypothetical protein